MNQVVIARTAEEVEELRTLWASFDVKVLDSDIDFFLAVVGYLPSVIRPHVMVIRRDAKPDLMAIARLEQLEIPIRIGYATIAAPKIRALVVSLGGLLGVDDNDDERVLIGQLRRSLATGEADMLLLQKLDSGGSTRQIVGEGVSWLRRSHFRGQTQRWVAEIPDTYEQFLTIRSAKTRKKLRYQERQLNADYGSTMSFRRLEEVADFDEVCRALEAVAARTYQRGLGVAYSGSPIDKAIVAAGLRLGWYRAWILYLGGRPVAFWHGTTYAGTFSAFTPGFDPSFQNYSIGTYTMLGMVKDLCTDVGVRRLDFGHGDAEYKRAFSLPVRTESDAAIVSSRVWPVTLNFLVTMTTVVNNFARVLAKTERGKQMKRRWRIGLARQGRVRS